MIPLQNTPEWDVFDNEINSIPDNDQSEYCSLMFKHTSLCRVAAMKFV